MKRLQRLRYSKNLRDLTAETEFTTSQLIQPLFVAESLSRDEEVLGLKGVKRNTASSVLKQIEKDLEAGVKHFILFNVPEEKSLRQFSTEFSTKVISGIKKEFQDSLTLWVDTCLCSSTEHGHCCVLNDSGQQDLAHTLSEISALARSFAEAGADGVSPSDMNDGRTAQIRRTLDEIANGRYNHIPVMSYSTKFASSFYGPFRNAADSAPQFGDRTQYQIDVRNRTDAINSSIRCAEEGADLLMVKPGMTAIDLIGPIKEKTGLAVGAYQVSGEYAGMALLEQNGLIDFEKGLLESWHVFKRAGAQYIITYGARLGKKLGVKIT